MATGWSRRRKQKKSAINYENCGLIKDFGNFQQIEENTDFGKRIISIGKFWAKNYLWLNKKAIFVFRTKLKYVRIAQTKSTISGRCLIFCKNTWILSFLGLWFCKSRNVFEQLCHAKMETLFITNLNRQNNFNWKP